MTDVRDVAKGIILAMQRGRAKRRYILGGHNLRLPQYHALLAELTGLSPPRIRVPPAGAMVLAVFAKIVYGILGIKTYVGIGDIRLARHLWMFDYSRARDELGLTCRSPTESLCDTLRWLQEVGYYRPHA